MTWFARRPKQGVEIRFTLQGQQLFAHVPPAVAAHCETMAEDIAELRDERGRLRQRIIDLNTESIELVQSATNMDEAHRREHERQQRRIDALTEEGKALRQAAVNAERSADEARASRDDALTEVRRLDGENVVLAGELLEASGRLADAEERLAGYERVTS